MNLHTNPLVIRARNIGRALGLNRLIARMTVDKEYESRFEKTLIARLQPGDTIYDIGANVGHYTAIFSDTVGEAGHVVAFEPSPANHARLTGALEGRANCTTFNIGLADAAGQLSFVQGEDDLGATSRFAETGDAHAIPVSVERGDAVMAELGCRKPNALKVDVEGYELEVLQGFGAALSNADLHTVAVEIHFGILAERKMSDAPARISSLLEGHGFTLTWPDGSHLVAMRP